MIGLKKDYERNIKLINEQMHKGFNTVQTHLPSTAQCCQGLSVYIFVFLLHVVLNADIPLAENLMCSDIYL